MVRSRLPVPSLLGLFGALLMLSPELLLGTSEVLSQVSVTDPDVQKASAFSVDQYNQMVGCVNYFKQLRLLQAFTQADNRDEYHLKVELVKTACTKRAGRRMSYERIQQCQLHPRTPERRTCYFTVTPRLPPNESAFTIVACNLSASS